MAQGLAAGASQADRHHRQRRTPSTFVMAHHLRSSGQPEVRQPVPEQLRGPLRDRSAQTCQRRGQRHHLRWRAQVRDAAMARSARSFRSRSRLDRKRAAITWRRWPNRTSQVAAGAGRRSAVAGRPAKYTFNVTVSPAASRRKPAAVREHRGRRSGPGYLVRDRPTSAASILGHRITPRI